MWALYYGLGVLVNNESHPLAHSVIHDDVGASAPLIALNGLACQLTSQQGNHVGSILAADGDNSQPVIYDFKGGHGALYLTSGWTARASDWSDVKSTQYVKAMPTLATPLTTPSLPSNGTWPNEQGTD